VRSTGSKHRRAVLRLEYESDLEMLPSTYQDVPTMMMRWGLHKEPQECIWVVAVGPELDVRTVVEVARGSHVRAKIHLPTLLAAVLSTGSERFLLVHNHPSNVPTPSSGDITLTKTVMEAANAAGLFFEDHLILTPGGGWHSMTLSGEMIPANYVEHELG
jgi:DNA repair protein RadC